jgi:hypothetical protein
MGIVIPGILAAPAASEIKKTGSGEGTDEYGAYITVRYWCPNLFSARDLDDTLTADELVRGLIQDEGVLGMEESHEIVSIEISET